VDATFAAIYGLALLGAGLALLVREIRSDYRDRPVNPLPAWNESIWVFLLFLSLLMVLSFLLGRFAALTTEDWENNPLLQPWRTPLVGLGMQGGMLLSVLLIFNPRFQSFFFFEARPKQFTFIPERLKPLLALREGFFGMLIALPLVGLCKVGWEQVLEFFYEYGYDVSLAPQELISLFRSDQPGVTAAMIFLAVVMAPIVEELVFRGVIYRYLKGRVNTLAALAVSGVLFSLINANWAAFLPLFLFGILLCRAYEKTQNILTPIIMHACFNANTILVIFLFPDAATM